jgi:hypothetical protein
MARHADNVPEVVKGLMYPGGERLRAEGYYGETNGEARYGDGRQNCLEDNFSLE